MTGETVEIILLSLLGGSIVGTIVALISIWRNRNGK
jgi:hypothetical protein